MKRPMPRCVVLAIGSGLRPDAAESIARPAGLLGRVGDGNEEKKDGRRQVPGHYRIGSQKTRCRKGDAVMQMRETQATDSLPLHRMKPQRGLFRTPIKEGRAGRYFWLSRERRSTAPGCGDSLPLTATLQQCLRIYFHNFIEPLRSGITIPPTSHCILLTVISLHAARCQPRPSHRGPRPMHTSSTMLLPCHSITFNRTCRCAARMPSHARCVSIAKLREKKCQD
jgi:hypothetical protein